MRTAIILALLASPAMAHDALSGWSYPPSCCDSTDCRQVPASWVKEVSGGYQMPTGETLPYRDYRVKDSPDGLAHWCTLGGGDNGRTLCLYVPPKLF